MTTDTTVIVVDAMGGDDAPAVVLEGVRRALDADPAIRLLLVGPDAVVSPAASDRCEPVIATQVIGMDEHPASAIRSKKDSSIVVGCRLVKEGRAAGFFSAGNTGACMAAATLVMGRIPGVTRPAITQIIPASARPVVLLDVGANADVKAERLVEFARMGSAYAEVVLSVSEPTVGLLNIGEEATKGDALAQEAYALLSAGIPGFIGNVEGRDIPAGTCDVVVTDGFTGNVALKTMEGVAALLFSELKEALTATLPNRIAASVVLPSLRDLRGRLDPEAFGGAPLLGVKGVCVIGHGGSGAEGVANGIAAAARATRGDLTRKITAAMADPGLDDRL
jgi:glycerol-3-phosphate acyltransferase PlsX